MNKVNGKWVSNEVFRDNCRTIAAKAQELQYQCVSDKKTADKHQSLLNSLVNVIAGNMREVERVDKIEAMKEANRSDSTTVIEWADAPDVERVEA